ncbi:4-hydroxy-tetrahydrodipicolinate reductase [Pseudoxanthomonas daejeonensis]|uniref:4-hydroxy-tetrahydrodipicolinate reductase n=1 Tax=Pseudoxanthomonas daejeonensis TaxID=266062 RepID=A0ABQ6Z9R6_9GAMM|nr:4-hydroxy-tetrahydrodipicolinate reductase [Pseudoxanthomonas daejeonensis]KAF1696399.1 4-hydroxy-tetrahydrodipicolinate reductase [Pseudoxanthomonas daejeonensis]
MDNPLRVLIHGASGRMGQALLRLAGEAPGRWQVVAAVTRRPPAQRGVDGGPFFGSAELPGAPAFDVAIDFSLPEGLGPVLELCVARRCPLVSGTTGLEDGQRQAIKAAATQVPLLWASNFSIGVAVLDELVERAARALPGWDCDIVESHHVHKKDAPSGTALTLGDSAGRGGAEPRYASLRAGDIVGEHLVQFAGQGERVELVHRATSRDIFAHGALQAASGLHGRDAGLYSMRGLLFGDS